MLDKLKSRRSCRCYDGRHITDEEMDKILEAGLWAPTGMNRQKVLLVAIQDEEIIEKLSKMNAAVMDSNSDPFYGAKSLVVVFSDREVSTCVEDGSLAMGNMMNEAEALGLGSCWIHRAYQVFETPEGRALADSWGVPASYRGIGNCILGYKAGEIADRPRLPDRVIKIG